MNSLQKSPPQWENLRTQQSRMVEDELGREFQEVDAYRYNPASIRVHIQDERFRGMSMDDRDDLVEPYLDRLPEEIRKDIVNLVLTHPGEEEESTRARILLLEFEDYSPSML